MIGIFILLFLAILKYAAAILIPITLAILLSLLFHPVVHFLTVLYLPKSVGAAIVVAGLVSVLVGGVVFLVEPCQEWLDKSP